MKFLIVDDDPSIRSLLSAIIEQLPGDSVREAPHGAAALKQAQQEQPDLVFMDIEMPVMDGITATRGLLQQSPGTTVIIVTGRDDVETRRAASESGASGFVVKDRMSPLEIRGLVSTYRRRRLQS